MAEQQLLQREGSPMPSSPVAAPDAVSNVVSTAAVEEPCSNGCADASWQDVMMQVPVPLHRNPASTHHSTQEQRRHVPAEHTVRLAGGW